MVWTCKENGRGYRWCHIEKKKDEKRRRKDIWNRKKNNNSTLETVMTWTLSDS